MRVLLTARDSTRPPDIWAVSVHHHEESSYEQRRQPDHRHLGPRLEPDQRGLPLAARAENYEQYAQDAQEEGDQELTDFFREAQQQSQRCAEQAKQLLASRLQGGQRGWPPVMRPDRVAPRARWDMRAANRKPAADIRRALLVTVLGAASPPR
jgi:hypothetical protein